MRMNRFLQIALCASAAFGVAVSAYAVRTRESAIAGWAEATRYANKVTKLESFNAGASSQLNAVHAAYRALWSHILRRFDLQDDLSFARAVNDYIYKNVGVGSDDVEGSYALRMSNALSGEGETALCGDLSIFLDEALRSSGVQSRMVQLASDKFVKGQTDSDTHVTVEASFSGKWLIIDPTFNAVLTCGDGTDLIGVREAHECAASGKRLVPHYGPTVLSGRLVSDYYVPLEDLYSNYAYKVLDTHAGYQITLQAPDPNW